MWLGRNFWRVQACVTRDADDASWLTFECAGFVFVEPEEAIQSNHLQGLTNHFRGRIQGEFSAHFLQQKATAVPFYIKGWQRKMLEDAYLKRPGGFSARLSVPPVDDNLRCRQRRLMAGGINLAGMPTQGRLTPPHPHVSVSAPRAHSSVG